jgi:ketosteroid isomerase-like protein
MSPKTLIRQWVETFNHIDIDGLANMYHEDAINHQVNTEPLHGREAIRQMFIKEFSKANMICEIENIFEDGVLGHARMEGP